MTRPPLPSPPYPPDCGSFVQRDCPLCHKPMQRPLVRPGVPKEQWQPLTVVLGWGTLHSHCAAILVSGEMQSRLDMEAA
jgi:hypothetical protein